MNQIARVDDAALQELQEALDDAFEGIVKTFLDSGDSSVDALEKAYQERNFEEIHLHAHSLKGASANLAALRLADYCAQIDTLAKESQGEPMEELIIQIRDEWEAVKQFFLALLDE